MRSSIVVEIDAPKSHLPAAFQALGLVAAGGAVGGSVGSLASEGEGVSDLPAIASSAVLGVVAVGLGGVGVAALSSKWRLLGLYTAGMGLGLPLAALAYSKLHPRRPQKQLPAGPPAVGTENVAAALTLAAGAQTVSVPVGDRLVLQSPPGGTLAGIQAPGLPPTVLSGSWVVLNVPQAGVVTAVWKDAAGSQQTTSVTVDTNA